MSAVISVPVVKGWCPGLFAPMQAQDGWLVRVRPPLGRMTAAQARLVADSAEQDGNGQISLTNRGNLQLRGFKQDAARAFSRRMVEAGLGLADPEAERRTALQLSPLAGLDPACAAGTLRCAERLYAGLAGSAALSALPDKFGFCVDGGGFFPTGVMQADIMLQAAGADGASGAGGGLWRVVSGSACTVAQGSEEAVQTALALAGAYCEAYARQGEKKRPLRVPSVGESLFAEIGLRPDAEGMASVAQAPRVRAGYLVGAASAAVAPLGRMTATMLRACAAVAEEGDGVLRLTPWSGLIFSGLTKLPDLEGMITRPDDARLRVHACIGVSGCAQAVRDVGQDALSLASLVPEGEILHVSGCSKGCAYPAVAEVTLVAGGEGYGLIRHGRAGDEPVRYVSGWEEVRACVQAPSEGERN